VLRSIPLPDTVNFLLTGGGTGTTRRNQVAELSRDKLPNFEVTIGSVLRLTGELRHHILLFCFFCSNLVEARFGRRSRRRRWEELEAEICVGVDEKQRVNWPGGEAKRERAFCFYLNE